MVYGETSDFKAAIATLKTLTAPLKKGQA